MFGMSLEEPPGAAGVVNEEVACDTELTHEEIPLDVPKLCPSHLCFHLGHGEGVYRLLVVLKKVMGS